jgi:hypothetical protein
MSLWWVIRDQSGKVVAARQEPNDDFTVGPLDDAADAGLQTFLNPAPQVVSRMQAMVALGDAGLLGQVQAWVNGQDAATQLIWSNASSFSRSSALLAKAAAALNLTSAQVDQLFVAAAAVNP